MEFKLLKLLLVLALCVSMIHTSQLQSKKLQAQSKALSAKSLLTTSQGRGFCWHPCYCWRSGLGGPRYRVCWCWYPCWCWWYGPRGATFRSAAGEGATAEGGAESEAPSTMTTPTSNPPSSEPTL